MKTQNLLVLIALTAVLPFTGCKPQQTAGRTEDPAATLPAKYKTQEPVPKPNFTEVAKDPGFQAAIKQASALLGAAPRPLESKGEGEVIQGGVAFDVPQGKIEPILLKAHTNFLAKGYYLFRCDQNFGIGGNPDEVGLLPTTDPYAVMAAMDTNGDNFEIGTAGVIAWMKELEKDHPFVLTGIGFDYMEGHFTSPVTDAPALAKRMYEFCPDIVDQGVGTIEALARELRKGKLYFWWD